MSERRGRRGDTEPDHTDFPDTIARQRPRTVEAVSHKPLSQPGVDKPPIVPVVDRPEMQPRIRPHKSPEPPQAGLDLGHYAPPRSPGQPRMSRSSPRLSLLIAAVVTAAVAVVTTWAVYRFVIAP